MSRTFAIWRILSEPSLRASTVSRRFFTHRLTTRGPAFESMKIDYDVFVGKKSKIPPSGDLPSPRKACFRTLPDLNDNPFGFKRGEVLEVDDCDTLTRIINFRAFKDTMVGIQFYTEWCEPCNWFNRYWEHWATKYPDSVFINCDVEKDHLFCLQHRVRAVPTNILYREFIQLVKIEGAYSEGKLPQMIDVISAEVLPVRGEPEFFRYYCSDQYYNGNEPDYY